MRVHRKQTPCGEYRLSQEEDPRKLHSSGNLKDKMKPILHLLRKSLHKDLTKKPQKVLSGIIYFDGNTGQGYLPLTQLPIEEKKATALLSPKWSVPKFAK